MKYNTLNTVLIDRITAPLVRFVMIGLEHSKNTKSTTE